MAAFPPMTIPRSLVVPHITSWSEEQGSLTRLVVGPRGGRLPGRDPVRPGRRRHPVASDADQDGGGRPDFGRVHPLRQRRVMRRLLCQVCGGPADKDERGTLWLLEDHRADWHGWPNGLLTAHPPVCVPCAREAVRFCPNLLAGHVAVRVGASQVCGVYGVRYLPGRPHLVSRRRRRLSSTATLLGGGCSPANWSAPYRTAPSSWTSSLTCRRALSDSRPRPTQAPFSSSDTKSTLRQLL